LEEQRNKVQQVSQKVSLSAEQLYEQGKKYFDAKNYDEALKYFLPAAEQGDYLAQKKLEEIWYSRQL
ncbi:MAG: hypothetical protein IJ587_05460, partial [Synergistaceae bacterium]|nr:hypothetical protein [Synergistaceae bacterium]